MDGDKDRYDEMCRKLNMDEATQTTAWAEFERICENFTMEGDKLHWLACALYVACRNAVVATVGGGESHGNSVSLTQILRNADLSLIEFFRKINNWMDMVNTDQSLRERIEALERKFEVTSCVFQKYDKIFREMFRYGVAESSASAEMKGTTRSRKTKAKACSPRELYQFCWTLYIYVKGHFPSVNGDLVNSHHLLLCCMDMIFAGALVNNRHSLLNPEFGALPQSFRDGGNYQSDGENMPCVMEFLCERYNGIPREAKAVREHYWRPYLKDLHKEKIFKGDEDTFMMDLFESPHFHHNNKSICHAYEQFVLSKGEFDEHIFLGENSHRDIGTPAKISVAQNTPFEARSKVSRNLARHFEKASVLSPPTPLTGRNYLTEKDVQATPVSSATQSVLKLQALVSGCHRKPSPSLAALLQTFGADLTAAIDTRLEELKKTIIEEFCEAAKELAEFAKQRVSLATVLYYKLLESILNAEKVRLKDSFQSSISILLGMDTFHSSLFACCVEIVFFSYNSQFCFPWIVNNLKISPYHFYKVIEIIIKEEKSLSRSLVKHFNQIEEKILDCLAWQSGSPLYESLPKTAPSYEDVAVAKLPPPPAAKLGGVPVPVTASFVAIPASMDEVTASAGDRFSSPVVIRQPTTTQAQQVVAETEKPKQTGSLGLFYRKVYHLAHTRLSNLCEKLEFNDESFRQKIWTCFEHSLIHHSYLMRDRHLDQLMMCAIYVMAKIYNHGDINFQRIMEHYRHQPQARSHIYRSVLIEPKQPSPPKAPVVAPAPAPTDSPSRATRRSPRKRPADALVDEAPAAASAPAPEKMESDEQRGDIIGFYNRVYVPAMKEFVLRFRPESNIFPKLSPLPVFKKNQSSPRRKVSANHSLYLSPHGAGRVRHSLTPRSKMLYCFSRSPAKKLKEMNAAVAARCLYGRQPKRLIVFNEHSPAKRSLAASPFADNLRSLSQEREDASSRDSMTTPTTD